MSGSLSQGDGNGCLGDGGGDLRLHADVAVGVGEERLDGDEHLHRQAVQQS